MADDVRQVSTKYSPLYRSPADSYRPQVLVQLQSQQVEASRQLQAVRAQLAAKEREKKLSTLTLREVEQLPREPGQAHMYRGVGRMYVPCSWPHSVLRPY